MIRFFRHTDTTATIACYDSIHLEVYQTLTKLLCRLTDDTGRRDGSRNKHYSVIPGESRRDAEGAHFTATSNEQGAGSRERYMTCNL